MSIPTLPGEKIEKAIRREHWEAYETHVREIRHRAKLSSFWFKRLREAFEAGFEAGRKLNQPWPRVSQNEQRLDEEGEIGI